MWWNEGWDATDGLSISHSQQDEATVPSYRENSAFSQHDFPLINTPIAFK